jgi:hypothetical protein
MNMYGPVPSYVTRPPCVDIAGHRYRPASEAMTHAMCERCADVVDLLPGLPPLPEDGAGGAVDSPPYIINNEVPSSEGMVY